MAGYKVEICGVNTSKLPILKEEEKKEFFVGVPGVFLNQERIMATMFGFPEFRTAKSAKYKTGNFGYWYRII